LSCGNLRKSGGFIISQNIQKSLRNFASSPLSIASQLILSRTLGTTRILSFQLIGNTEVPKCFAGDLADMKKTSPSAVEWSSVSGLLLLAAILGRGSVDYHRDMLQHVSEDEMESL
jgi:hypothetical protein